MGPKKSYPGFETDPAWYKDAIFYELRVGAFQDSDDDGRGEDPVCECFLLLSFLGDGAAAPHRQAEREDGRQESKRPASCRFHGRSPLP